MTEKHPLPWRAKKTPKRGTRRSRNWVKLSIGHHFEGTTWTLVQGPWRQVKRTGSLSHVTVRCAAEHGGCDREYDRILNTIIRGDSKGCIHCHMKRLNQKRRQLAKGGSE